MNHAAPRRASRRERARGRPIRLRSRDLDILQALFRMRAVRTRDVARLFFTAKGTAQKRLRRLLDAGLARPLVGELASESRWTLTRAGHALLEEAADAPIAPFRPAPRVDARKGVHHDIIVGYWTALAHRAPRLGVELVRFRPEWELRAADPMASLVPDALVTLATKAFTFTLSIECDTGSQSPRIVDTKLDRYDVVAVSNIDLFGTRPDAVLFVTLTERRARTLARHVALRAGMPVLLGPVPHVFVDGGLTTGLAEPREVLTTAKDAPCFVGGLLPRA